MIKWYPPPIEGQSWLFVDELADDDATWKAEDAARCYANGSGCVNEDEGEWSERWCHCALVGSPSTEDFIGRQDFVHGYGGVFGW